MDAENRFEKVRAAIGRLNPCVHACAFYSERDEEVAMAATYVRAGLARDELCVCIVDDGREPILDALSSEGVDTEGELREGRLVFFEKQLARNLTTLDMLGKIEQWTEGARRAGHSGCRISGEMTWVLDGSARALEQLAEFEAQLSVRQVYERHACIGLCQFDLRRFTPDLVREMIVLHPFVVVGDRVCRNPYYVPPERYLSSDWPLHETDWMLTNLEQLQRAQDGLQASQERYCSLARRTVQLQEMERRDISRELHDRVGQSLTAMRINLDLIRKRMGEQGDAQIRARVEDSMGLVESTFKFVQDVMYDLRPPMMEEHGLVTSLRWYAKQFTERTGIHVEIQGVEDRCGAEVEIALFRIAQEALNNVARHSGAKNVRIELRDTGNGTVLTVDDDGVGFDAVREPPAGRTGYGLVTMRERAEAVAGTFEMRSEKAGGTRITVTMPQKR